MRERRVPHHPVKNPPTGMSGEPCLWRVDGDLSNRGGRNLSLRKLDEGHPIGRPFISSDALVGIVSSGAELDGDQLIALERRAQLQPVPRAQSRTLSLIHI